MNAATSNAFNTPYEVGLFTKYIGLMFLVRQNTHTGNGFFKHNASGFYAPTNDD